MDENYPRVVCNGWCATGGVQHTRVCRAFRRRWNMGSRSDVCLPRPNHEHINQDSTHDSGFQDMANLNPLCLLLLLARRFRILHICRSSSITILVPLISSIASIASIASILLSQPTPCLPKFFSHCRDLPSIPGGFRRSI